MIELIIKKIMQNIAQYTQLFDIETASTTCDTINNTVTITGLNGDYVLSGGVDGIASKSCLNQMLTFVAGVATTDCFFGDTSSTVNVTTHKVNVGKAVTRAFAMEMMVDDDITNAIIVYWDSTQNTQTGYKYTLSEDNHTMLQQKIGVLMKINTAQMQALGGCDVLDKIIANSIINIDDEDATLIRFDNVKDRFFAGKYYCVDIGFSYLEDMRINDIIKDRLKNFDTILDTIEII
jgi:hypothetical protein